MEKAQRILRRVRNQKRQQLECGTRGHAMHDKTSFEIVEKLGEEKVLIVSQLGGLQQEQPLGVCVQFFFCHVAARPHICALCRDGQFTSCIVPIASQFVVAVVAGLLVSLVTVPTRTKAAAAAQ